jgi:hypothetical protein
VTKFIHDYRPKDVIAQWEKVNNEHGIAFFAPMLCLHFLAILKGRFKRILNNLSQLEKEWGFTLRIIGDAMP